MKIVKAGIQDYYTQTGVGENLLFYWKYHYGSHSQTAYQINIYKDKEQLYLLNRIILQFLFLYRNRRNITIEFQRGMRKTKWKALSIFPLSLV